MIGGCGTMGGHMTADYGTMVAARQAIERIEHIRESESLPGDMTLDELIVTLDAIADGQA